MRPYELLSFCASVRSVDIFCVGAMCLFFMRRYDFLPNASIRFVIVCVLAICYHFMRRYDFVHIFCVGPLVNNLVVGTICEHFMRRSDLLTFNASVRFVNV